MEKKSLIVIGVVVVGLAVAGWFAFSGPTKEEQQQAQNEKMLTQETKKSAEVFRGMADAFDGK